MIYEIILLCVDLYGQCTQLCFCEKVLNEEVHQLFWTPYMSYTTHVDLILQDIGKIPVKKNKYGGS